MNNSLDENFNHDNQTKINWNEVQSLFQEKFGVEIYESWLKKIDFVEEHKNYILLSVSTRFIRDWITSRYLDQILQIIKLKKKELIRIELSINHNSNKSNKKLDTVNQNFLSKNNNVSFIKDSYLQYNRFDSNKRFENFVTGKSNKLAYVASKKVTEDVAYYNPLYIYGGVGMGKTHLLNAIGINFKDNKKVMFISAERFMYQFVKSLKSNDMV